MSDAFERFGLVLRFAGEHRLTDVLFKAGARPFYGRTGQLISRPQDPTFEVEELTKIAEKLMSGEQMARFNAGAEITLSYPLVGAGRFRVHIFRQRASVGLSVRVHPGRARGVRDLGLPQHVTGFCARSHGVVIVSSPAGHGRTTTIGALLDLLNSASPSRRIVSIGAANDVALSDKTGWTCQRAIGVDASSWVSAVRGAIAQGADVLAVDEVPDADTLDAALDAAERGTLVFLGVGARDMAGAIRKLLARLPADREPGIRRRLSAVFIGGIEQTLAIAPDGTKLVPACGILVAESQTVQWIRDGHDPAGVYEVMHTRGAGMQTRDQHLAELVAAGKIKPDVAMMHAIRPQALTGRRASR